MRAAGELASSRINWYPEPAYDEIALNFTNLNLE